MDTEAIMEEDNTHPAADDIMGTAAVITGDIMDLAEELMVAVGTFKVTGVMVVDTTIPIERNTSPSSASPLSPYSYASFHFSPAFWSGIL